MGGIVEVGEEFPGASPSEPSRVRHGARGAGAADRIWDLFCGSVTEARGTIAEFQTGEKDPDHDPFHRDGVKITAEDLPYLSNSLIKDRAGTCEDILHK